MPAPSDHTHAIGLQAVGGLRLTHHHWLRRYTKWLHPLDTTYWYLFFFPLTANPFTNGLPAVPGRSEPRKPGHGPFHGHENATVSSQQQFESYYMILYDYMTIWLYVTIIYYNSFVPPNFSKLFRQLAACNQTTFRSDIVRFVLRGMSIRGTKVIDMQTAGDRQTIHLEARWVCRSVPTSLKGDHDSPRRDPILGDCWWPKASTASMLGLRSLSDADVDELIGLVFLRTATHPLDDSMAQKESKRYTSNCFSMSHTRDEFLSKKCSIILYNNIIYIYIIYMHTHFSLFWEGKTSGAPFSKGLPMIHAHQTHVCLMRLMFLDIFGFGPSNGLPTARLAAWDFRRNRHGGQWLQGQVLSAGWPPSMGCQCFHGLCFSGYG